MALRANDFSARTLIQNAVQDLPAFPAVVAKIVEATNSDVSNAASIEELLTNDQALASKLLRIVNSPYFGLSGQVSSLSQAVVLLGLQQVRSIVLSMTAVSLFKAQSPGVRDIQLDLWQHSLTTAAGAELIAKRKRADALEVEAAFVGGLLHDLGSLFLLSSFPHKFSEMIRESEAKGEPMVSVERRHLDMDHAEIGFLLSQAWNFPKSLQTLIGAHEGPFDLSSPTSIKSVYVADRMSSACRLQSPTTPIEDQSMREWLGMTDDELLELREEVSDRLRETADMFGIL